jgi:alkylation response protein AidB-like acyl-CoA dehydrogenase
VPVIRSEAESDLWRACVSFAQDVVEPRADDIDRTAAYPQDIFEAMRKADLLGLCIPDTYGGGGGGMVALCLAIEAVARHCSSSGLLLLLSRLAAGPLMLSDNEAMKQRLLPALAAGDIRGSFCLTEPSVGSDALHMKTTAESDGDDYRLNGVKCYISGATEADFFIVWALVDDGRGGREPAAFVVDRDASGLAIGSIDDKMGVRGVPTAEVLLHDCRVPGWHRLSPPGKGTAHLMQSLNSARPGVAARGVGLAEGVLTHAIAHAESRVAFGTKLIDQPVIQQMLADVAMHVEASSHLVRHAADLIDAGRVEKETSPAMAMAKCFATDTAVKAASECLQVLGAAGYMRSHPVERLYRDAKQLQIVEGTNQIQRLIVARGIRDGHVRFDR